MGPDSKPIQVATACVLVVVIALSMYVRFHRITEQGISPGDNVRYFQAAAQWPTGKSKGLLSESYYRPAVYTFQALALKVLGLNDYSIKIFNGIADTLNLCLIGLVAYLLCGNLLPATASILLYALLPRIVEFSRSEMPHTLSTFFVLSSLLFFLIAFRKSDRKFPFLLLISLCGLSLGLAANTHADLALLGPVYAAYILMSGVTINRSINATITAFRNLSALVVGFTLPYLLGLAVFGSEYVFEVFGNEFLNHTTDPIFSVSRPLYLGPADVLVRSTRWTFGSAWPILPLFLAIPAMWLFLWLRGRHRDFRGHVPLALILGYALLFPLFIGTFTEGRGRIFVPLIPILLISVTCWYYAFLEIHCPKWTTPIFLVAFVSIYASLPNVVPGEAYFQQSSVREIHDAIASEVNENQKLLIVPSTAGHVSGFKLDYYFGSNAIPLGELPLRRSLSLEAVEETLVGKQIAFVYFHGFVDLRGLNPDYTISKQLETWLRPDKGEYSFEDERRILERYFTKNDASTIPLKSRRPLYDLRKRSLFHNSGFELGTLENWHPEGDVFIFKLANIEDPVSNPMADRNGNGSYWIDTIERETTSAAHPEAFQGRGTVGVLTSDSFRIKDGRIGFLIGGSENPNMVHVALRIRDTELRTKAPGDTALHSMYWDVADYVGEEAKIFIRDLDSRPGSGIRADFFHYRD